MAGFDREVVAARSRALHVCEIGTIDCIHDPCSQKRASARKACGEIGSGLAAAATATMLRVRNG
jgi:hypothetical protein